MNAATELGKPHVFTRQDWLVACQRLLPHLTDAQREAFCDDVERADGHYNSLREALR